MILLRANELSRISLPLTADEIVVINCAFLFLLLLLYQWKRGRRCWSNPLTCCLWWIVSNPTIIARNHFSLIFAQWSILIFINIPCPLRSYNMQTPDSPTRSHPFSFKRLRVEGRSTPFPCVPNTIPNSRGMLTAPSYATLRMTFTFRLSITLRFVMELFQTNCAVDVQNSNNTHVSKTRRRNMLQWNVPQVGFYTIRVDDGRYCLSCLCMSCSS